MCLYGEDKFILYSLINSGMYNYLNYNSIVYVKKEKKKEQNQSRSEWARAMERGNYQSTSHRRGERMSVRELGRWRPPTCPYLPN